MRLGFFLREALRSIRRNAAPSFAALATVLVTMLVLGVFIPVVQATNGAANSVRSRVLVDVYLKTDADRGRRRARAPRAARPCRTSSRSQFVSKAAGATRSSASATPQAYELLGSNPLPDTFHVIPDNPANVLAVRNALAPAGVRRRHARPIDPAIRRVSNNRKDDTKQDPRGHATW